MYARSEEKKDYYRRNKKHILARCARYRADNPEKRKNTCDKYRKENKAKERSYYQENKLDWRKSQLLKDYGVTFEEYQRMFRKQRGKCAICNVSQSDTKKTLAVDHCHKTKKIRALLCTKCNPGLGFFNDDIKLLEKAIKYLKGHGGEK